jgi:ABC-2 type transport system ATP-binding protein
MNDIELSGVSKHFDDVLAVQGLSFQVRQGSIFGLLGPNGAGKTTAIRMIANIIAPDSGELTVLGERPSPNLHRRIGYVPEERGLFRGMRILEQIIFFAKLKGIEKAEARKRGMAWLERLGLANWTRALPGQLSKGMGQKIQFIIAVVHDPQLLILDEPFTGLDPISVAQLKEVILELRSKGKTILFSTHQMDQVEQLCEEICLLDRSLKVLGGSLHEVKSRFGRNTVVLDSGGVSDFLGNDLASEVTRYPNHFEIKLNVGVSAQEILRRAMVAGACVNRFEFLEPSLNQIFIDTVRNGNGTNNGHTAA